MLSTTIPRERLNSYPLSRRGQDSIAWLIILSFFLLNALSVQGHDWTYDEPEHYQYGMNLLNGDSTRFDDSKMPVSAWNALPARVGEVLPDGPMRVYLKELSIARLMTTLFSMVVAFMVFYWARELYGWIPAFFSLALYVLDPNIIAHSQLVTTDLYVTGMVLFCSYWLRRFANDRKWQNGLWLAVMLGLAQLTKYTAVSLYGLFAIAWLVHDWPSLKKTFETGVWQGIRSVVWQFARYALVAAAVSILIINVGFLFNRTFTSLRNYSFRSELFRSIQSKVSFVVPVPYPYLEGLDWVIQRERTNTGFGRVYLLGETRFAQGFPGYYFIASLLKVPISTQIILLSALAVYLIDRQRWGTFLDNEWFLLWPVLFYTLYFNFFYRAQMGIRFYLVIFPLLYVFAGGLFIHWRDFGGRQKIAVLALGIHLIVSVISYYPSYLSYFNEIVWERKTAYRYLADSNLDWGQDGLRLKQYLDDHPTVRQAPVKPDLLSEKTSYFLEINLFLGITTEPGTFEWLRENFEPVGTIASSYLLFEITPEQMKVLCERTVYCKQEYEQYIGKAHGHEIR
jgi:hypothetical protein